MVIALTITSFARADIRLDRNFPWDVGKQGFQVQHGEPVRNAIGNYILKEEKYSPHFDIADNDFRISVDGDVFYISALHYESKEQKHSPHPIPGGGICAIYLADNSLNVVASLTLKFKEFSGNVYCNGISGIGQVKGQNALLATASYYPTEHVRLAQSAQEIGKNWRRETFLLRLTQQDGHWALVQDDDCLGNPNTLSDIPSARLAMKNRPACKNP